MNAIRNETGARLDVPNDSLCVIVSGSEASVRRATAILDALLKDDSHFDAATMPLPGCHALDAWSSAFAAAQSTPARPCHAEPRLAPEPRWQRKQHGGSERRSEGDEPAGSVGDAGTEGGACTSSTDAAAAASEDLVGGATLKYCTRTKTWTRIVPLTLPPAAPAAERSPRAAPVDSEQAEMPAAGGAAAPEPEPAAALPAARPEPPAAVPAVEPRPATASTLASPPSSAEAAPPTQLSQLAKLAERERRLRRLEARLDQETAAAKQREEEAATPRLVALRQYLELLRKLAASRAKLGPTWNLKLPSKSIVPAVLTYFSQLSTGANGAGGPVQLWRSTNVSFIDDNGAEAGIDQGGLTAEMHGTFWTSVFHAEHGLFERSDEAGGSADGQRATGYLPRPGAPAAMLEAAGRVLLKSVIDDHPTGRFLGRFVFEFLCGVHEQRVFVSDRPLEALRALEDFDEQLAEQWRSCVQEEGKPRHRWERRPPRPLRSIDVPHFLPPLAIQVGTRERTLSLAMLLHPRLLSRRVR